MFNMRSKVGGPITRSEDECIAMIRHELYKTRKYSKLSRRDKEKIIRRIDIDECMRDSGMIGSLIDEEILNL